MLRCGIDLVEVDRAERLVSRHPDSLKRFLRKGEFRQLSRSTKKAEAFAAIFAAKEAASKALHIRLTSPGDFEPFEVKLRKNSVHITYHDSVNPKTLKGKVFSLVYQGRRLIGVQIQSN